MPFNIIMLNVLSSVVVDCGTDVGGPVSVEYTNSDPGNNPVVRMSSPLNKATCAATETSGVFTITDARTNCDIVQPASFFNRETFLSI